MGGLLTLNYLEISIAGFQKFVRLRLLEELLNDKSLLMLTN